METPDLFANLNNQVPDNLVGDTESEVFDSDDFESDFDETVATDVQKKLRKLRKEKEKDEFIVKKYWFYAGQRFASSKAIKDRVYIHSIETRRKLKLVRNDKVRVRAKCEGPIPVFDLNNGPLNDGPSVDDPSKVSPRQSTGPKTRSKSKVGSADKDKGKGIFEETSNQSCPWELYCTKELGKETWICKTHHSEHLCLQTRDIKACNYKFLSFQIMDEVAVDPEIPTKAVQDALQKKWVVNVSRMKAFRAKAEADKLIVGDHKGQYALLRDYAQELMTKNQGTTVKCQVKKLEDHNCPTRVFRRIYVCLGALKKGFKASRRELLGLDEAFINSPFPCQLLTAV